MGCVLFALGFVLNAILDKCKHQVPDENWLQDTALLSFNWFGFAMLGYIGILGSREEFEGRRHP